MLACINRMNTGSACLNAGSAKITKWLLKTGAIFI
jgi:hypothetical protein